MPPLPSFSKGHENQHDAGARHTLADRPPSTPPSRPQGRPAGGRRNEDHPVNEFESMLAPEPAPAPECRPLTVRDLKSIAARKAAPDDPPAEVWMVRLMSEPVLRAMSKPMGATVDNVLEATAELVSAPLPIVARGLLEHLRRDRSFCVASVLELVEQERQAADAAAVEAAGIDL